MSETKAQPPTQHGEESKIEAAFFTWCGKSPKDSTEEWFAFEAGYYAAASASPVNVDVHFVPIDASPLTEQDIRDLSEADGLAAPASQPPVAEVEKAQVVEGAEYYYVPDCLEPKTPRWMFLAGEGFFKRPEGIWEKVLPQITKRNLDCVRRELLVLVPVAQLGEAAGD